MNQKFQNKNLPENLPKTSFFVQNICKNVIKSNLVVLERQLVAPKIGKKLCELIHKKLKKIFLVSKNGSKSDFLSRTAKYRTFLKKFLNFWFLESIHNTLTSILNHKS